MITIDARGKLCPVPLIMTRKALNGMHEDDTLEIILDNETSVKNVTRFLEEHGMKVVAGQLEDTFRLIVNKTGTIPEEALLDEYCVAPSKEKPDYVIAIQKRILGQGDDELGELLMKGFINTLPEISNSPDALVFLNSGIFLALKESPVLESLSRLQQEGTTILVCGTCLDYFGKKEELAAGIVSNMYDILEIMSRAGKVLYP